MRKFLIAAPFIVAATLLAAAFLVNIEAQTSKNQPPAAQPPAQGKIVVQSRDSMPKFREPVAKPHGSAPTHQHPGHHARWHPYYGWVYVPVTVSPNVVVLESTYQLPAQVAVYQSASGCTCPWCGQPITLGKGY